MEFQSTENSCKCGNAKLRTCTAAPNRTRPTSPVYAQTPRPSAVESPSPGGGVGFAVSGFVFRVRRRASSVEAEAPASSSPGVANLRTCGEGGGVFSARGCEGGVCRVCGRSSPRRESQLCNVLPCLSPSPLACRAASAAVCAFDATCRNSASPSAEVPRIKNRCCEWTAGTTRPEGRNVLSPKRASPHSPARTASRPRGHLPPPEGAAFWQEGLLRGEAQGARRCRSVSLGRRDLSRDASPSGTGKKPPPASEARCRAAAESPLPGELLDAWRPATPGRSAVCCPRVFKRESPGNSPRRPPSPPSSASFAAAAPPASPAGASTASESFYAKGFAIPSSSRRSPAKGGWMASSALRASERQTALLLERQAALEAQILEQQKAAQTAQAQQLRELQEALVQRQLLLQAQRQQQELQRRQHEHYLQQLQQLQQIQQMQQLQQLQQMQQPLSQWASLTAEQRSALHSLIESRRAEIARRQSVGEESSFPHSPVREREEAAAGGSSTGERRERAVLERRSVCASSEKRPGTRASSSRPSERVLGSSLPRAASWGGLDARRENREGRQQARSEQQRKCALYHRLLAQSCSAETQGEVEASIERTLHELLGR